MGPSDAKDATTVPAARGQRPFSLDLSSQPLIQRRPPALPALQLLSLVIGAIAKAVSTPAHPLHLQAGFSISGWLAVLLTFLLARVFAEGTRMREDLEATV